VSQRRCSGSDNQRDGDKNLLHRRNLLQLLALGLNRSNQMAGPPIENTHEG
jgi:hypothetical protein